MIFMDVRWMKRAFHWPPPIRNLGGDFLRQNSESVVIVPPFGSIYLKIEIVETINATVTGPFLSGYLHVFAMQGLLCLLRKMKNGSEII